MQYRIEQDSLGDMIVSTESYWGAQTERSRINFPIGVGNEEMPMAIIRALAILKGAAAKANAALIPERMTREKAQTICSVCSEILLGELDEHFPLVVFQTGSGTHSNMNINEVIANRGNYLAGKRLLHPNDDVNMSQSSTKRVMAPPLRRNVKLCWPTKPGNCRQKEPGSRSASTLCRKPKSICMIAQRISFAINK